jgi:hypothetical protein
MNTQLDAKATPPTQASGFFPLAKWREKKGRSRSTIHRWRKVGIIREHDIREFYGKLYISNEGMAHVDSLIASQAFSKPLHGCAAVSHSTREEQLADLARDPEQADLVADEEFKNAPHP